MKKLLFFASAGLLMASCSDDLGFKTETQRPEGSALIVATYAAPESSETGTRSEWEWKNGKPNYLWSVGDVLGVFPVVTSTTGSTIENTNATFKFDGDEPAATGEFIGDNALVGPTSNVYAYYPWEYNKKVTQATADADAYLQLLIPSVQTYNFKADVSSTTQDGSFSQNMAPAVAYGTYNQEQGQYEMEFSPVGAYLGVPIVGFTPTPDDYIKSLTLEIINTSNVLLSGYVNAPLNEEIGTKEYLSSIQGLATDQPEGTTESKYITIDCGVNGVELDGTNPTWFYFVVPAGININSEQGVTYNLYVNANSDLSNLTQLTPLTANKKVASGATVTTTVANTYYNIWQEVEKNEQGQTVSTTPFEYVPENTIVINDAYEFLEYAYLASYNATNQENGYSTAWEAIVEAEEQDNYILANALIGYPDDDSSITWDNITGLKKAFITNTINLNTVTFGSGSKYEKMTEYAQLIFNGFYGANPTKTINTIGGMWPYSINGFGENASINNLNVSSDNGMFQAPLQSVTGSAVNINADNTITVSNLTFNSCTVAPKTVSSNNAYYFLGTIWPFSTSGLGIFNTFSDITINSNCSIQLPKNPAQTNYLAVYPIIFDNCGYTNQSNVNNYEGAPALPSNWKMFAGYCLRETNYDLTGNSNLMTLAWGADMAPTGIVFKVSNKGQAEEVINYITTNHPIADAYTAGAAGLYPYSVVDASNSYWTGTVYSPDQSASTTITYAEQLAWMNQKGARQTIPVQYTLGDYDFDLMGVLTSNAPSTLKPMVWPISSDNVTAAFGINGNNKTISNALLDGTFTGDSRNWVSLFGQYCAAQNLTISNMTVNISEENAGNLANAQISALANQPSKALGTELDANIEVTGFNVNVSNIEDFTNPIGGIFYNLSGTRINNIDPSNCSATFGTVIPTTLEKGWLAALYSATISTSPYPLVFPAAVNSVNAFASYPITVNPAKDVQAIYVLVSGWTSSTTGAPNELVAQFIPAGTAAAVGGDYTIFVVIGSTQYVYTSDGTTFTYTGSSGPYTGDNSSSPSDQD